MVDIIRDNILLRDSISSEFQSWVARICPIKKVTSTRIVISDEDMKERRELHASLTRDVATKIISIEAANRQIELDDCKYRQPTTHWVFRKFW